ncbi:MAG: TIGR04283 family arsenosugar biosynthesis glycosyltransferase [Pseudomonadota bacterium]
MISFVIPVLNEGDELAQRLINLRAAFPASEIVMVDGGSHDASVAHGICHADVVLQGPCGRARQMNLGAQAASGPWLCFLHADTIPEFRDADLMRQLTAEPGWGFCQVKLSGRSSLLPIVSWFMNRRSRFTSVATGDQMLVIHRRLFDEHQGFADIPLMEDVELCKRLRRLVPPRVLPLRVQSSGRRWDQEGALRTIVLMWTLRLAYWLGCSPSLLWSRYYGGKPSSLTQASP